MRGRIGFILLFAISLAHAQVFKITGTVTDSLGKPLSGTEVIVRGTMYFEKTNADGEFIIEGLGQGNYTLEFYLEDYSNIFKGVQLFDKNINLDITLKYNVVEGKEVKIDIDQSKEDLYKELGHKKLKDVEGTHLNAARKTEVTDIANQNSNKSAPPARQTYSKNAGLTLLQSDAAGIQLDIGARGMNPQRTANFNTRQNEYDISADALGYPESYYTPVLEGVQEIQIIRGAASLEYGPQFGGLLNFVMKEGPKDDQFELISRTTAGSYNFLSFFNSIGGQVKNTNYYVFHQYKLGNDSRPNSAFDVHNFYATVKQDIGKTFSIKVDFTHMNYLAQQAGGLTDSQFHEDPRQSTRDRNFFKIDWNLANLTLKWSPSKSIKLQNQTFGIVAQRASLGNLDIAGDQGLTRNLINGEFKNIGNETRLLKKYNIANEKAVFTAGLRLYKGNTNNAQGIANNGTGPDFSYLADSLETSNYLNPSYNVSFYLENMIQFDSVFSDHDQITIVPGYRLEYINTESDGVYSQIVYDKANNITSINDFEDYKSKTRTIHLYGIGLSYRPNADNRKKKKEYYINFTRNYKSVTFSDLSVVNPNLIIDPNITDETGFNFDIGARGRIFKYLAYDLSAFYLYYNDRIGTYQKDHRQERTNIGNSRNIGIEMLVQTELLHLIGNDSSPWRIQPFINFSTIDAQYIDTKVSGVSEGNKVEMVPSYSLTAGLEIKRERFGINYQITKVGEYYSDAGNTTFGDQFYGIQGLVPSYYVMDLSVFYELKKYVRLEASVNNLSNNQYYTRRANSYPGPGIIPAPARSVFLTLQIAL